MLSVYLTSCLSPWHIHVSGTLQQLMRPKYWILVSLTTHGLMAKRNQDVLTGDSQWLSLLKIEPEGPDDCASLPLWNLLVMTSDWQYGFRDVRSLDTKIFNQSEPTESHLASQLWNQGGSLGGIYTTLQWRLGFYPFTLHWRCKATLSHWRIQRETSYIPWTTAIGLWLYIKVSASYC